MDSLQRTPAPARAGRPVPSDAVAALLVLDDGRYVMQLRDKIPGIFYPAHWGCFGGAIEQGETPELALKRELREELEFDVGAAARRFTRFDFDFASHGYGCVTRIYFEVRVSREAFGNFVLHEGVEFRAIGGEELLSGSKVTPYDAFAVWMHMNRSSGLPALTT
jgi:8-oxo-dGTP pyrophosphatase MutT (NUDIX family)